MTTQSRVYPEVNVPQSLKNSPDGRSVTETIETAVPELQTRFRHMVESSKSRVTQWRGGFQEGIRARPIQFVLIATAVGAVIGLIVGRRSR